MNKLAILQVTNEELDALCLALNEAAAWRDAQDESLKVNHQVARVYEALRKKIRAEYPLTAGMQKLVEEASNE